MAELEIKHLDKRTQGRYLNRGVLTEKELEKHLKALPDLADKAVKLETQQPDEFTPSGD
jgi:hypothetical protein